MPRKHSPSNCPSRPTAVQPSYDGLVGDITVLLSAARRASARAVNALMTATYWEIGRRIVEFEQGGKERAEYGDALLKNLSRDLTQQLGRGFLARIFKNIGSFTWLGLRRRFARQCRANLFSQNARRCRAN